MYIPQQFNQDDPELLLEVMQRHSFATLVTSDEEGLPVATPLPLCARLEGETFFIEGHMARANPQWRDLERGATALAIFHGPHGYISPSLYTSPERVPTWNYIMVQAHAKARVVHDEAGKRALLARLVGQHEPAYQKQFDEIRPELVEGLLSAIVAFELRVTRIEGKFKLNQHRLADYKPDVQARHESGSADEQEMAAWMRRLGFWKQSSS
jgi:transcriptional regulator